MHRVYHPARVVLSRLDAAIVDAEIRAELQRGLDDVPAIADIPKHAVAYPEVRFEAFGLAEECLFGYGFSSAVEQLYPLLLHEVIRFQQRELHPAPLHGAEAALIVEFSGTV